MLSSNRTRMKYENLFFVCFYKLITIKFSTNWLCQSYAGGHMLDSIFSKLLCMSINKYFSCALHKNVQAG